MTIFVDSTSVLKYTNNEHALAIQVQPTSQHSIPQQSLELSESIEFESLCINSSLKPREEESTKVSQDIEVLNANVCPIKATSITAITNTFEATLNI